MLMNICQDITQEAQWVSVTRCSMDNISHTGHQIEEKVCVTLSGLYELEKYMGLALHWEYLKRSILTATRYDIIKSKVIDT